MKEIWKNVIGYENIYQVSNLGNLKSLCRKVDFGHYKKVIPESIKAQRKNSTGYFISDLSLNGNKKTKKIHRLVAEAFISNPKNKPQVNHIDGNKLNNCINNLEWCTQSENNKHARLTGLMNDYGENSCHSKLTTDQVIEIRKKYSTGNYKQVDLSRQYNVGNVEIHRIVRNKRWKHLNDDAM